MRGKFLWLIPLGMLILFAAFLTILPSLVSSSTHRATIEALASSLTGRSVHIGGKLSLALFPEPQLIAEQITIGGPDKETITAQSLTLDIAVTALLRGRLSARNLTLQSPIIEFPWPLPGGAAAIAPPAWLTTLHAQIADGAIGVGALNFQHVNADIYTGANGALSVSGSGAVRGQPVTISLSLAGLDAAGSAPVSIDAQAGPLAMHLSGTFNAASALSGTLALNTSQIDALGALGQPASATATINADPDRIALTKLQAFQGDARLTGTASLALGKPILSLDLAGNNLILPGPDVLAAWSAPALPVYLSLDATSASLAGTAIPHLATRVELSAAGADISALTATLPGNSTLSLAGTADPAGQIAGRVAVNSNDFSALLGAFGAHVAAPDSWRQTSLTAHVSGSLRRPDFQRITGTLGPGYVTGELRLDRDQNPAQLAGALHFDTLDLTPFGPAFSQLPGATLGADLEITADHALVQTVKMDHLLIDASLNGQLIVRRLSASLAGGLLAASFTMAPNGEISAARALLSLPSAAPLAALIPAAYRPPAAVTAAPLSLALNAAGPPGALATSATLTLGDFSASAAPVLDIPHLTAAGPLTLRHPSAIEAAKLFGLNAGLAWPGAGSLSLRAGLSLSPTSAALPDFVLSFGDLTATGKLSVTGDQYSADINADTLALPPWPADPTLLWTVLLGATGKITLTANRILYAGAPLLAASTASLTLQPNSDQLTLATAPFANGNLTATISATTAPATPPSLAAKFALTNADASQLTPPFAFPLTLPAGTIAAQGNLTAAGYTPQTWAATLAGSASLAAKSGNLTGFNLAAAATALAAIPRDAPLKTACLTGSTGFDTLSAAGDFDHGIYSISAASLQSQAGTATATGTIDLPDQAISLTITLRPNVPSPPKLGLAIEGNWSKPQKIAAIRGGLAWTSTGSVGSFSK